MEELGQNPDFGENVLEVKREGGECRLAFQEVWDEGEGCSGNLRGGGLGGGIYKDRAKWVCLPDEGWILGRLGGRRRGD